MSAHSKPLAPTPLWDLKAVALWACGEAAIRVAITLNCSRTVEGYIIDVTNHIVVLTADPAGGGARFIPFHAMSMIRLLS